MQNIRQSIGIFGAAVLLAAALLSSSIHPAAAHAAVSIGAGAQYGKLPLSFIANAGQMDPSVRFQARASSGTLSFSSEGVTLSLSAFATDLSSISGQGAFTARDALSPVGGGKGPGIAGMRTITLNLNFRDANPNATIDGADQLPGIANFLIGNDPSQWHTNVPTYAGVVYHDLYPGVDLHYGGHAGLLKGTYTVVAGADPTLIHWQYTGANNVNEAAASGDLLISGPDGVRLREQTPVAWQMRDGKPMAVNIGYQIGADSTVQFAVGVYDKTLPLVIDPGLDYSTYLGGSGDDFGYGIAVDGSGNAFVTGMANSPNFPITPGAFQMTYSGSGLDAFVSKLNPAGSALVYSTYLGGSGADEGSGIVVDGSGNAYVTGYTESANFPITPGTFQPVFGGNQDAFVSRLNATGSTLTYSTYLGGSLYDYGSGIAVDGSGNAYVTGSAGSGFPTTAGAYQTATDGEDAFVTKLNAAGSAAVYSTYLGGNGADQGAGIAVDGSGNAFVTGYTLSANFPTTNGAFQPVNYNVGTVDAFVSELNPSVSGSVSLVYSTYLGGSLDDYGRGIAVDASGNAYITGSTDSPNFPTTFFNTFQPAYSGSYDDAFVSKLNPAGSALIYSTYLGGNGADQGAGIAVDASGNAYVTGSTDSANFPTNGAFQTTLGGNGNAFVSKLNASGSGLVYSTYLGGSGGDEGNGIAVDANGNAYVTGDTTSSNFPTTLFNAFQIAYGGGSYDAFVSKFGLPAIDTIGIFRSGTFLLRLHNSTGFADISVAFNPGTKPYPVVGDWTGAGSDTVGTFDQNNGLFSLCNANVTATCANSSNVITLVLGNANDMPLSGRWRASATHFGVGVFRPSNGLIYLKNSLSTGFADDTMVLGIPGDIGLAGDWIGQGFDSPGVYRPSTTYFYMSDLVCNCSVVANQQLQYGIGGDAPLTGDWTGQGHDGVGLFRQSSGFTYLKNALTTGFADITFTYGVAGDVPVAGHYQLIYPPAPAPSSVLVPPTSVPVPTGNGSGNDGLRD